MPRPAHGFQHGKTNRGFSIIEVMVTLVVLAVGLVGLAKFQSVLLRDTSLARERSEAVALAQSRLEQLRNFTTSAVFNTYGDTSTPISGLSADYNRTVTVSGSDPKTVAVTVSWNDTEGNARQVSLNSEISGVLPDNSFRLTNPMPAPLNPNTDLRNGGGDLQCGLSYEED